MRSEQATTRRDLSSSLRAWGAAQAPDPTLARPPPRLRTHLDWGGRKDPLPNRSRVLVVEPDPIRREGLVACLSRDPDLDVVGAGPDLLQAVISAPSSSHLDILVINVDQPETKKLRFWAVLRVLLPPTIRVVALTYGTDDHVLETLLAGVSSRCARPTPIPRESAGLSRTRRRE